MERSYNSFYSFNIDAATAFEAGEDDRLMVVLDEWQNAAASKRRGRMYPNAIHMRHIYQGMIALRSEDVETAKTELIKAGKVPGSPTLTTMGPNMMLADALLKRGERQAVFNFFKALRNFWIFPIRMYFVHKWKSAIAAGKSDVFGKHVEMHTSGPSCSRAA